jgi:hypothetical protein
LLGPKPLPISPHELNKEVGRASPIASGPRTLAPLAGEVAKPPPKERARMRPEADGNTVVSQPRCEINKSSLLGAECQDPGEVLYRGTLLCGSHAALLGLEDRAEALLNSVFRMDEWMEGTGDSPAEEEFVGRIRHERDEAVGALRLIRGQLRTTRKALG